MKHLIMAVMIATLAVVATNARANNITADIGLIGGAGAFDALHTDSSPFTDTFNFAIDGSVLASASLVTIGFKAGQDIDFISATLNGEDLLIFSPGSGQFESALTFGDYSLTGPLQLVVMGTTDAGGGVNASYAGTLNVTSVPVPEPASLMLLGAGLAGIGIWRRKSMKI